jgi:hypothetical protein
MYIRGFVLAEMRRGFVDIFGFKNLIYGIFHLKTLNFGLKHYVSPEDPKLFRHLKLQSN